MLEAASAQRDEPRDIYVRVTEIAGRRHATSSNTGRNRENMVGAPPEWGGTLVGGKVVEASNLYTTGRWTIDMARGN